MNNIAVAALSFTAGVVAGFAVAQFVEIDKGEKAEEKPDRVTAADIKKEQVEAEKVYSDAAKALEKYNGATEEPVDPAEAEAPQDDDPTEFVSSGPAHIARPGKPGVNYAKVQQIVQEKGLTSEEEIQDVINDPDNEETYEELVEREQEEFSSAMAEYRKKNKDKIVPITRDEWDTDFPEVDYEHRDLYYFTGDKVLTDEDGNTVDIEEYMGTKPGQFGWYDNAEEVIYIRNNPKETDFKVWKEQCMSYEWWCV